ncbi:hypothetical protein ACLB1M_24765 [Escherichia coli]
MKITIFARQQRKVSLKLYNLRFRAFVMRDWILSTSVGVFHRNDNGGDNDDNGLYLSFSLSDTPTMDSNNNSHSTNVSTDYRYSEQDGDQTSWQLSHTFYNDSFSHKELA